MSRTRGGSAPLARRARGCRALEGALARRGAHGVRNAPLRRRGEREPPSSRVVHASSTPRPSGAGTCAARSSRVNEPSASAARYSSSARRRAPTRGLGDDLKMTCERPSESPPALAGRGARVSAGPSRARRLASSLSLVERRRQRARPRARAPRLGRRALRAATANRREGCAGVARLGPAAIDERRRAPDDPPRGGVVERDFSGAGRSISACAGIACGGRSLDRCSGCAASSRSVTRRRHHRSTSASARAPAARYGTDEATTSARGLVGPPRRSREGSRERAACAGPGQTARALRPRKLVVAHSSDAGDDGARRRAARARSSSRGSRRRRRSSALAAARGAPRGSADARERCRSAPADGPRAPRTSTPRRRPRARVTSPTGCVMRRISFNSPRSDHRVARGPAPPCGVPSRFAAAAARADVHAVVRPRSSASSCPARSDPLDLHDRAREL